MLAQPILQLKVYFQGHDRRYLQGHTNIHLQLPYNVAFIVRAFPLALYTLDFSHLFCSILFKILIRGTITKSLLGARSSSVDGVSA